MDYSTVNNMVTARIARLKEEVLSSVPSVCTERAKSYTSVYRENGSQPVIIRRALALKKTLIEMTIFVQDGELITGNHSSRLRAAPIFPEYASEWILDEMDEFEKRPGDAFFVTDVQKNDLKEICSWWKGKTLIEKGYSLMSPLCREIHEAGIIKATGNLTSGGCLSSSPLIYLSIINAAFLPAAIASSSVITSQATSRTLPLGSGSMS